MYRDPSIFVHMKQKCTLTYKLLDDADTEGHGIQFWKFVISLVFYTKLKRSGEFSAQISSLREDFGVQQSHNQTLNWSPSTLPSAINPRQSWAENSYSNPGCGFLTTHTNTTPQCLIHNFNNYLHLLHTTRTPFQKNWQLNQSPPAIYCQSVLWE
jgi:hypothetical protein